jgi:hypothetical protein
MSGGIQHRLRPGAPMLSLLSSLHCAIGGADAPRMLVCTTRRSRPPWREGRATTRCASHSWTVAAKTPAQPSNNSLGNGRFITYKLLHHHAPGLRSALVPFNAGVQRRRHVIAAAGSKLPLSAVTQQPCRRSGGMVAATSPPARVDTCVPGKTGGKQRHACSRQQPSGRPCALAFASGGSAR